MFTIFLNCKNSVSINGFVILQQYIVTIILRKFLQLAFIYNTDMTNSNNKEYIYNYKSCLCLNL